MLPRLLDTLSATFQASSTRMDGLIGQMTQELEKVGVQRQLRGRAAFELCCSCCALAFSLDSVDALLLRRSVRRVGPRLSSGTPHAASCWLGSESTRY